jgi:hypothetical protein
MREEDVRSCASSSTGYTHQLVGGYAVRTYVVFLYQPQALPVHGALNPVRSLLWRHAYVQLRQALLIMMSP